MAPKTDKITHSFIQTVRENIPFCRIILFGSRAKGTAKKTSDYDFLLISPEFKKWEWEKRSAKIYYLKRKIPAAMDIICLTPQEFDKQKKEIGVIQQIAKEGFEVAA